MRKPKKFTALLLALTLLFACAACGRGNSTTDSGKTISGTLPEIIDRLYDTVDVDDEQRDFLKNSVGTVEIPKDQSAYYFGVENLDFEEAVASEPFINAIAFSVCLMRVKDGTDIDELKAEIRRSANPAKWICVGCQPERRARGKRRRPCPAHHGGRFRKIQRSLLRPRRVKSKT